MAQFARQRVQAFLISPGVDSCIQQPMRNRNWLEWGRTFLAKSGSLSIREVIDPLDTKDRKGARDQKNLVFKPGIEKWARQGSNCQQFEEYQPLTISPAARCTARSRSRPLGCV